MQNRIRKTCRLYENCPDCGVASIACICHQIEPLKTTSNYVILTSFNEATRASSTGRLFQLMNPGSTEIVLWERTKPPLKLIQQLDADTMLVFPAFNEAMQRRVSNSKAKANGHYILIDGTWDEARKIIRKSPYLEALPIVSLVTKSKSAYTLRRNGNIDGGLCTIEAIIELLILQGEDQHAKTVARNFELFMSAFRAGQSGHKLSLQAK